MGFNLGTIAIRGKSSQEIHATLGLRATEMKLEEPDSPVAAAMLPTGWYQLLLNDRNYPDTERIRTLSQNAELIFLDICETVMVSRAVYWNNGQEVWSIEHDAQRGLDDLTSLGAPPECLERISERLKTSQIEMGDADYIFDVPVEVTRELTGFRYDGNPDGYPVDEFIVLERIQPPRKWWHFWL